MSCVTLESLNECEREVSILQHDSNVVEDNRNKNDESNEAFKTYTTNKKFVNKNNDGILENSVKTICVKQEPEDDFSELEQHCSSAAIENANFDNSDTENESVSENSNGCTMWNVSEISIKVEKKEVLSDEECNTSNSVSSDFMNNDQNSDDVKESGHTVVDHAIPLLTCFICESEFLKAEDLKAHIEMVHSQTNGPESCKDKPYKCPICFKAFKQSNNCTRHIRIHSKEKPYKCELCGKAFSQANSLKLHTIAHSGEKPFKCDTCGKGYTHKSALKQHEVVHDTGKGYNCAICDKVFAQSSQLKQHMHTHTGEKNFSCELCGKMYSRAAHVRQHMMKHTNTRPFSCEVCQKSFFQLAHLQKHRDVHKEIEKTHKCLICGKAYGQSYHLKDHMKTHTDEKPHECHVCGKAFLRSNHLRNHVLTHTDDKPVECPVCHKRFKRTTNLSLHMITHADRKPHECPVCKKLFGRPHNLKQHMLQHTGEKPFKCDQCDKAFSCWSNLKKHRLYHTGEKPFPCPKCPKKFVSSSHLNTHLQMHERKEKKLQTLLEEEGSTNVELLKTITTNALENEVLDARKILREYMAAQPRKRPYECEVCHKSFPRPTNLKQHMLLHTGEKPYKCDQCEKAFSCKSNLRKHKMYHSGEKPHQCSKCFKKFVSSSHLNSHMQMHERRELGELKKELLEVSTGEDKDLDEVLQVKIEMQQGDNNEQANDSDATIIDSLDASENSNGRQGVDDSCDSEDEIPVHDYRKEIDELQKELLEQSEGENSFHTSVDIKQEVEDSGKDNEIEDDN